MIADPDSRETTTPGGSDSALGTILSASAVPYGYTVTLWSSGALLVHYRSFPGVVQIILFAAGAVVGHTLVGLLVRVKLRARTPVPAPAGRAMLGMLHWFAVCISVGAVALLAQIPGWVAWPLGSMAATTLYLAGAAAELTLLTRTRRNR